MIHLVRLLVLLACGPLLLPTGFCVCKAAERGSRPQVSAVGPPGGPPVARKAGCCSKCATTIAEQSVAAVAPLNSPPPDDHLPGCPASPAADSLKWIDPSPQLVTVLALPVVTVLTVEPTPTPVSPVPAFTRWPSLPPLYLSHRALVI